MFCVQFLPHSSPKKTKIICIQQQCRHTSSADTAVLPGERDLPAQFVLEKSPWHHHRPSSTPYKQHNCMMRICCTTINTNQASSATASIATWKKGLFFKSFSIHFVFLDYHFPQRMSEKEDRKKQKASKYPKIEK